MNENRRSRGHYTKVDKARSAIVQLSPRPGVVGGRGTDMQPRGSRRAVRLEERYGRNRRKVNDGPISPQRKPSRTLVAHRTTRAIQPRTRARSLSDSRPASPRPIVPIPNAWFRRKVRQVWVGGLTGHCGLRDIESKFQQFARIREHHNRDPRRLPPRKRRRNLIRPPSGVAVFCVVV